MARLLPFLKMDTVLIISSWPTGLYDYVQYMQMQSICIVIAYADGKYMRMPHLCRCPAYGYVEPMLYSLFSRSDPKKASSGSASGARARCGAETQDVALCQLLFLLYVVFTPFPVTRRAGADIAALLIRVRGTLPETVGAKSDHTETAIR
jgi:hypothetical protein